MARSGLRAVIVLDDCNECKQFLRTIGWLHVANSRLQFRPTRRGAITLRKDDIPETRSAAPMPRGAAPFDEDQVFRDIIGRIGRLPEGVRRVEYRLGEDSVGAPAVWFTFISRDDLNLSKEKD